MRRQRYSPFTLNDLGYFTVGIIKITDNYGISNAFFHTIGLQASFKSVSTKITLVSHSSFMIIITCLIGTGQDAIFTTDAFFRIEMDNPIFSKITGSSRTYVYTGGFIAVHAVNRHKKPVHRRIFAYFRFYQFDP
jgi:hypothetical protein